MEENTGSIPLPFNNSSHEVPKANFSKGFLPTSSIENSDATKSLKNEQKELHSFSLHNASKIDNTFAHPKQKNEINEDSSNAKFNPLQMQTSSRSLEIEVQLNLPINAVLHKNKKKESLENISENVNHEQIAYQNEAQQYNYQTFEANEQSANMNYEKYNATLLSSMYNYYPQPQYGTNFQTEQNAQLNEIQIMQSQYIEHFKNFQLKHHPEQSHTLSAQELNQMQEYAQFNQISVLPHGSITPLYPQPLPEASSSYPLHYPAYPQPDHHPHQSHTYQHSSHPPSQADHEKALQIQKIHQQQQQQQQKVLALQEEIEKKQTTLPLTTNNASNAVLMQHNPDTQNSGKNRVINKEDGNGGETIKCEFHQNKPSLICR